MSTWVKPFDLWNTSNPINFCHSWLRKLREIGSKKKKKKLRNTLAGVTGKATGVGIQLWARDVIRFLPGSSPSELGALEMCKPDAYSSATPHRPVGSTCKSEGTEQKWKHPASQTPAHGKRRGSPTEQPLGTTCTKGKVASPKEMWDPRRGEGWLYRTLLEEQDVLPNLAPPGIIVLIFNSKIESQDVYQWISNFLKIIILARFCAPSLSPQLLGTLKQEESKAKGSLEYRMASRSAWCVYEILPQKEEE